MKNFLFGSRSSFAPFVYLCLGLAIVHPLMVHAQQTTGSLTGTVVDKTGKPIAAASISVTDTSSKTTQKASADADGHFSITVAPGTYDVAISAPGFADFDKRAIRVGSGESPAFPVTLDVAKLATAVTVEGTASIAAETSPSQNTLEASSPKSIISQEFVDNFISPVSDYSEVIQMAPGTFSINSNGVGLGQAKTFFRGFSDGEYTISFDGIPFEDTNSPTHHSWSFFPSEWLGGTDFDRSPGSASTFGPTNFGGSIDLLSRDIPTGMDVRGSISYGSFNTRLLDLEFDSGQFGKGGKSSLLLDVHQLNSDGYETYNSQKRDAGSLKYQYKLSDKTTITLWGGLIDLWNNTPNTNGPTRAQVAQYGDNYLLSGDPTNPLYYGFNFYHVQTDFEYIGVHSDLGSGWKFDDKVYTYRYWNKQNYNSSTAINATSGVDKLNGYRKLGDTLTLSQESRFGIFRTGLWYEWAYTDRYQYPTNPRTWVDTVLPNFHEHFITQTLQPFVEYEWRPVRRFTITAGVKFAYYNMYLNQYADNGKIVGNLGGAAFVTHSAGYTSTLPALALHYMLTKNWSIYAQYAAGSIVPPSSVFDTKNAAVKTLPSPSRTNTYQIGSTLKLNRLTLSADAYYIRFQNAYTSYPDPVTFEPIYTLPGDSRTKGFEAEGNFYAGYGISVYLNGTAGKAYYVNTGLWVANAPRDTETVGLTYQRRAWDFGFFNKRVGQMYNDFGTVNQAVSIQPFELTNAYVNYTMKDSSHLRGTKFRLSVNNIQDSHAIVGITPAQATGASPNDVLTLLPGRSIMLTVTAGYAPRR